MSYIVRARIRAETNGWLSVAVNTATGALKRARDYQAGGCAVLRVTDPSGHEHDIESFEKLVRSSYDA